MIPIELKELASNLKNRDYEVNGAYKVDKQEAEKIVKAIEKLNNIDLIDRFMVLRLINNL